MSFCSAGCNNHYRDEIFSYERKHYDQQKRVNLASCHRFDKSLECFRTYLTPDMPHNKFGAGGLLALNWRPRCGPSRLDQEDFEATKSKWLHSHYSTMMTLCHGQFSYLKMPSPSGKTSRMKGCSTMCSESPALYSAIRSVTDRSLFCFTVRASL